MHHRNSPTVRPLLPARRVIAGALAAGAVAVAVPAAADAAVSTCSYSAASKTLVVNDHSGAAQFRLERVGDQIRIADGLAGSNFCPIPGQFAVATVHNTDKIQVFRDADSAGGGVTLNMSGGQFGPGASPESDGSSEIEIAISDASTATNFGNALRVIGSSGNDTIVASTTGSINLGNDFDGPDVTNTLKPFGVEVRGGEGADRLRGSGSALNQQGTVFLAGEGGNDTVMGGPAHDHLSGGIGDDRLTAVDGRQESVDGDDIDKQPEGNDFASVDDEDVVSNVETKAVEVNGVGKLKLRKSLHAAVGETARVAIGWKHPQAWKSLRSLEWRLMDGVDQVGAVKIRPRSGKLVAAGAVKLAKGSTVSHKGKTVTAQLKLRLPAKLVGAPLSVDVAATDANGRRQLEAAAALLDVTA